MSSKLVVTSFLIAAAGTAGAQISITPIVPPPGAATFRLDAINADGTKGAGSAEINNVTVPVTWSSAGGVVIPSQNGNWHDAAAELLTADGQSSFGYCRMADLKYRAVSWKNGVRTEYTLPAGKQEFALGAIDATGSNMFGATVPTGAFNRQASRVSSQGQCVVLDQTFPDNVAAGDNAVLASSSNGLIVFGDANRAGVQLPVRWTIAANGSSVLQSLGSLPGSTFHDLWDASADGSTAVGIGGSAGVYLAWSWNATQGLQPLEFGPNDQISAAFAISANARVIGGVGGVANFYRARFWVDGAMFDFADYMQARGVDMSGWNSTQILDVNPDGSIVVGTGVLNGQTRGFVAHIRCLADMDFDFQVDLADFFAFLNAFDVSGRPADVNDDGVVDLGDFFDFLNAFDTGC